MIPNNHRMKLARFASTLILLGLAIPSPARATPDVGNIWVDPSTEGKQAKPGEAVVRTIGEALKLSRPGTTIHVEDGVYEETITPIVYGTADAPITIKAVHEGKAVLDGDRLKDANGHPVSSGISCGFGKSKEPQFIHVEGFRVTRFHSPLQQSGITLGSNWVADHLTADHCDSGGIGIAGNDVVLTNSVAEFNGEQGIGGSGHDIVIRHIVSRHNNAGIANPVWKNDRHAVKRDDLYHCDPEWEGGGGKFANVDRFLIEDSEYFGNGGVALWFDIENKNVVIRNVSSHDNLSLTYINHENERKTSPSYGIAIEISPGPVTLENNTLSNNSGGGIALWESQQLTLKNNHFRNNPLMLRNIPRRAFELGHIVVTGNDFEATVSKPPAGILVMDSHSFRQASSIDIHDNTYSAAAAMFSVHYYHNDKMNTFNYSIQAIQDLGWDSKHPSGRPAREIQREFQAALGQSSYLVDFLDLVHQARVKKLSRQEIRNSISSGSQVRALGRDRKN